jgi:site-specific recombinase XerC
VRLDIARRSPDVKGLSSRGEEVGHSPRELVNGRARQKRDRALLALLLACGLRRHEAVALTLDHLQQREEHWAIVDLVGKGGHIRTVQMSEMDPAPTNGSSTRALASWQQLRRRIPSKL